MIASTNNIEPSQEKWNTKEADFTQLFMASYRLPKQVGKLR